MEYFEANYQTRGHIKPCLITGATSSWRSGDLESAEALAAALGDLQVSVWDAQSSSEVDMPLRDYIDYAAHNQVHQHCHQHCPPALPTRTATSTAHQHCGHCHQHCPPALPTSCCVLQDDNPLYVFEKLRKEGEPGAHRPIHSEILSRYKAPAYFSTDRDLLSVCTPPLVVGRWLLVGSARSGSDCHIDTSATSAWNTSLYGRKRSAG